MSARPSTLPTPSDPSWEARVRTSFDRQRVMATLGATLDHLAPGEAHVALDYDERLTQQHGFVHAGVLAAIADSACGYAALTLMPADAAVLSVEFKINMVAPARAPRLVARAVVLKAGRTITLCRADVLALDEAGERLVAAMQGTMMTVRDRGLQD